jgi:PQQ-like domain
MNAEVGTTYTSRGARAKGWTMAVTLFLAGPLLAREQLTIQKSSTNLQLRGVDATLSQANPTSNYSTLPTVTVASSNNANQRALVEFDLSALPNVGIKQAVLTLHVTTQPSASVTYGAYPVSTFFYGPNVTWDTRVATTAWGAPGGDIPGTATTTTKVTKTSTTAQFTITPDVQEWYNATPNYGTLIKDQTESDTTAISTVFGSQTASAANVPQLQINFVQNVSNLSATPGNGAITLNWTNPTPLSGSTVLEPYFGIMILRYATLPVHKSDVPTDGTQYPVCTKFSQSTVVFVSNTLATTFTDNSSDTCGANGADPGGAPQNGTDYYYKVFVFDTAFNYSCQPLTDGTVFTEEISAVPGATAAAQQKSLWIDATYATDLSAPSLFPGSVIMIASQTNLVFGIDPNTESRKYPPVSIGGPVFSRSPIIDSGESTLAENVIYVGDSDGLVYGIATDTGQIVWVVNPNSATTNDFQGGVGVQLKTLSSSSYTLTDDLVTLGTRNGATTTTNQIFGLDGNTGATLWTLTGTATLPMDIVDSTPLIDYVNNAIWVTTHGNCSTTTPTLWKINPNTGAILLTEKLGDTDASPALSFASDVLFVANNGCSTGTPTLYAINPATGVTLASFPTGDGSVVDYPVVLGSSSPYTIVFSGTAKVHAVTFTRTSNLTGTFATVWTTPITVPSAPICYTGLSYVYVGSNDGTIHELNLATGADVKDEIANTGQPGFVGDVSLDVSLARIYVSTTDQRAYGFAIPF